jgi:hypothetical protein
MGMYDGAMDHVINPMTNESMAFHVHNLHVGDGMVIGCSGRG